MIERVAHNPIFLIRMKGTRDEWLYSEKECLRLLDVWLAKAQRLWEVDRVQQLRAEIRMEMRKERKRNLLPSKQSGRGTLFWRDSE